MARIICRCCVRGVKFSVSPWFLGMCYLLIHIASYLANLVPGKHDGFDIDHRVLRIVASALSILTTSLVFDQGFHYPLRLMLLHLSAILPWDIIQWLSYRNPRSASEASNGLSSLNRSPYAWSTCVTKFCLHLACVVGTLFCNYQAIYHFRSLPALTMLLSPDWGTIAFSVASANISTSKKIAATLACVAGAALILVFESHLSGASLKLSILGIFFATGAQLLAGLETDTSHEDQEACYTAGFGSKAVVLPLAICITLAAIYKHEYLIYIPPPSNMMLGTLAINTLAAVVTFCYSGSFFRQTEPFSAFHSVEESDDGEVERILEPISLQTLIVLGSVLLGSSITTTLWQYIGFWVVLSMLFWTGRQHTSNAEDDTYYASITAARTEDIEYGEPPVEDWDANERHGETRRSGLFQVAFAVFCILLSILPMAFHQTSPQPTSRWTPKNDEIDTIFNTTQSLDFVVSRYDESAEQIAHQLNSIQQLTNIRLRDVRIVVYSTGSDNLDTFKGTLEHSLHFTPGIIVEQRSNVGKEAAAYLHHITSKWKNLSDHTLFIQAEMHDFLYARHRIQNYLIPQTGFLPLSDTHEYCSSCNNCWDHSSWSESPEILNDIYARANSNATCEDLTLTYRGQCIASRSRIQEQGKQLFQDLLDDLVNPESAMHSPEYIRQPWLPNKKDSLNAPLFGYTIERMWGVIMGCTGKRIAEQCPSMLAGSVSSAFGIGPMGHVEDCQCLDF